MPNEVNQRLLDLLKHVDACYQSHQMYDKLCIGLIRAAIADAEKAQAERALPVTREWFESLNRRRGHLAILYDRACDRVMIDNGHDNISLGKMNRGQVLDLLSALGVKEQP